MDPVPKLAEETKTNDNNNKQEENIQNASIEENISKEAKNVNNSQEAISNNNNNNNNNNEISSNASDNNFKIQTNHEKQNSTENLNASTNTTTDKKVLTNENKTDMNDNLSKNLEENKNSNITEIQSQNVNSNSINQISSNNDIQNNCVHSSNSDCNNKSQSVENQNEENNSNVLTQNNNENICSLNSHDLKSTENKTSSSQIISKASSMENQQQQKQQQRQQDQEQQQNKSQQQQNDKQESLLSSSSPVQSSSTSLQCHKSSSSIDEKSKSMMSSSDSELKSVSIMKQQEDIKQLNEYDSSSYNKTNQDCNVGVKNKCVDDTNNTSCSNNNTNNTNNNNNNNSSISCNTSSNSESISKSNTVQNDLKFDYKNLTNNAPLTDHNKNLENDNNDIKQINHNSDDSCHYRHQTIKKPCDILCNQDAQDDHRLKIENFKEAINEETTINKTDNSRINSSVSQSIEVEKRDIHTDKNLNTAKEEIEKQNKLSNVATDKNQNISSVIHKDNNHLQKETPTTVSSNQVINSNEQSKNATSWKTKNSKEEINVVSSSNACTADISKNTVTSQTLTQSTNQSDDTNLNQNNISTTIKDDVQLKSQNNTNFVQPSLTEKNVKCESSKESQFFSLKVKSSNSDNKSTCKTPTPSKVRHFFDQGNGIQNYITQTERTCRQLPPKKAVSCVPADCSSTSSSSPKMPTKDSCNKTPSPLIQNTNDVTSREYCTSQNNAKENYTSNKIESNNIYQERIPMELKSENNSYPVQSSSNDRQHYNLERSNSNTWLPPTDTKNESKLDKNAYNQNYAYSMSYFNKLSDHTTQSPINFNNKKEYYASYANETPSQTNKVTKSSSLGEQKKDNNPYRTTYDYVQMYSNPISAHNFNRKEYNSREMVSNSLNSREYEKSIENVVKSSNNYQSNNNSPLYVNSPDFSKQIPQQSKSTTVSSSPSNSLKQLQMKPPDFTKINSNAQQEVDSQVHQSSVLKSTKSEQSLYKHHGNPQITEQNFAEISKKYNYISDLRLKNPPTLMPSHYEEKSQSSHHKSTKYSNLYMKAPGFSMQHFQNQKSSFEQQDKEGPVSEHQNSGRSTNSMELHPTANTKHTNSTSSYAHQYPQLSNDVEMSIVPPKTSSRENHERTKERQDKPNPSSVPTGYSQYQNYTKENMAYNYERQQHLLRNNVTKSSSGNTMLEPYVQHQRHEYPSATSYSNSVHLQKRDVSPRTVTHPEQQQTSVHYNQEHHNLSSQSHSSIYHQQPYSASEYLHKLKQLPPEQSYNEREHYPYSHSQSGTQSVIQQNIKSKDRQEYLNHHQIQSPLPRVTESPTSNSSLGRQMQGSPYYHHQQLQQSSPSPHLQSVGKNTPTPPSPVVTPLGRTYNQTHISSSPSNPSSPQCPPPSTYKTSPSPGAMNPPYAWPSHTTNSRISQSPVASPHYRVTQSPIAPNGSSPQSPIFRQPSPKPSRSPTLSKSSSTPQLTNLNTNYKNSSYPPGQNYYQLNDTTRGETRVISTNYVTKGEKISEKSHNDHSASTHYRTTPEQKATEQMISSPYSQKSVPTGPSRYPGYSDYPCQSRADQSVKASQKYIHPGEPQYPIPPIKYSDQQQITSRHEKPNYREMINHVYAIRSATSEEDLNYEIIKRTLNKDISVRRSDSDLSKNIFDCPVPTKINHCNSNNNLSRSNENFNYMKSYEVPKRLDSSVINKYPPPSVPYEIPRKSSITEIKKTDGSSEHVERLERRSSLPICNDLVKNDISVTVSKVIKPTIPEKPKLQERESQHCSRNAQSRGTHGSDYSNVVISRVDANQPNETNVPINCRPRDLTAQQPYQHPSIITEPKKPTPMLSPVKKESPLDLSVKTVKTKADSTGCDEYSGNYYNRGVASSSQSFKVDFSPNFSKHATAVSNDVRQSQVQPSGSNYDTRHTNNVQTTQKTKQQTYSQQIHNQYNAAPVSSQSNPPISSTQKSPLTSHQSHQPIEMHQYSSLHQSSTYPRVLEHHQRSTATHSSVKHNENINNKLLQNYPSQDKIPPYSTGYDNENYKYYQQYQPLPPLSKTHQVETARLPSPSRVVKREYEQSSHLTNMQKMEYKKSVETNNAPCSNYTPYPRETRKDNSNYPYVPLKHETIETNRQSIILNPAAPATVYDKRSDDYLVNIPQKHKKVIEKVKTTEYEGNKIKDRTDFAQSVRDPYAPLPIHKVENPYAKITHENSNIYKGHTNEIRSVNDQYYKQQLNQQHSNYNQQSHQVYRDKAQEEYFRKMETQKSSTKFESADNKKPELQPNLSSYTPDFTRSQEYKTNVAIGVPSTPYVNEIRVRNDYLNEKVTPDYSRKRQLEPIKDQQPPEKQVRVDELYRAHLEKTYKQQYNQQQHIQFAQNASVYQQNQKSEISTVLKQDVKALENKKDYSDNTNKSIKNRYLPYKDEHSSIPLNPHDAIPPSANHQTSVISHQHPASWYSSTLPSKEIASQSSDGISIKREHYGFPLVNNYSSKQDLNERNKMIESNSRQNFVTPPIDASQKPAIPISSNSSNGGNIINRGADQNVLSKLRTSIEMREFEKQKSSMNKKSASEDACDEENKPSDIASLLAARIRTKGELKGYTPLPALNQDKSIEKENNSKLSSTVAPPPSFETFSDGEGRSTFDLMDWGSACNNFVEQLQMGANKKRGKRRKSQKTVSDNTDLESEKAFGKSLSSVERNREVDKNSIEKMKVEGKETETKNIKMKIENKDRGGQTSSDEDKPLLLLRQQSNTDVTVVGQSDVDKNVQKSHLDTKEYEENVADKTNRNSLVERLSEKIGRNIREKQRLEQEKRIAARIGSSTSDSEDEIKRAFQRPKKLTRKPRSRTSGASTRELSDTDSSGAEDKSMSRNLIRSRRESRKRKIGEKTSTESDSNFNTKKISLNTWVEDSDDKTKSPLVEVAVKREFITKARVKCMKLPSETSDDSEDNADEKCRIKSKSNLTTRKKSKNGSSESHLGSKNSKCIKDDLLSDNEEDDEDDADKKGETESTNSKNVSEDESKSAQTSTKNEMKKVPPLRLSRENFKIEETMTRSKRKKELEQRIANSKILRNEKIVQNTTFDRKSRPSEKMSTKFSKQELKSVSTDKSKNLITKRKNSVDLKRKRNDNDTDDKMKKKMNRFQNNETDSSLSENSEEESKVSDRLRSKRTGFGNEQTNSFQNTDFQKPTKKQQKSKEKNVISGVSKITPTKKSMKNKSSTTESSNNTQTFPPGWEMEVYQYKRALKVPANLITIKGPAHHRVSTSLPDLDSHSSDASESCGLDNSKNSFRRIEEDHTECSQSSSTSKSKRGRTKKDTVQESKNELKHESSDEGVPKSIIDVLHSRLKAKKSKKNTRVLSNNEPKILPRGNNEAELLPTPIVKENKPAFASEHRNLFETEILKSRTRTESRVLKTKELIREVFGGEDRPASAPPELRNVENEIKIENVTFDEKYEQYLQKMNIDFGEKIRKNKKGNNVMSSANNDENLSKIHHEMTIDVSQIKQEKMDDMSPQTSGINQDDEETRDTEINACMQNASSLNIKEETQDTNERDTPSVISERDETNTPSLFTRKRTYKSRNGRRKGGSSGFDYIRKKKKPTNSNNASLDGGKRRRLSPVDLQPTRSENDVSKEIQKWVLNKSVGQSALHKAARLGYLDVIAYCLERLGMHPDPKDNAGYTPLHEACSKGRLEIARVLLQYGANHSETAHSGIRPLHEASENGYIEIVRLLLSYGADPLVTTYSGQTPLVLAENHEMEVFLKNHLHDVQNTGPHKQPWRLPGPWFIFDKDEYGYDILAAAPEFDDVDEEENDDCQTPNKNTKLIQDSKKTRDKCDNNSNIMCYEDKGGLKAKFRTISAKCTVVLNNIGLMDNTNSMKQFNDSNTTTLSTTKSLKRRRSTYERNKETKHNRNCNESDIEGELFEFEESEMPLPPLYLLKDEGTEKWVLLNDLCNLLKVKSKDTLLKQICPSMPPSTVNKELLRELKTSDFLEKAICLQLLCAGEKLNIRSSKVVLVKYNENVRNVLGVKTISMKF